MYVCVCCVCVWCARVRAHAPRELMVTLEPSSEAMEGREKQREHVRNVFKSFGKGREGRYGCIGALAAEVTF